MKSTYPIYNLNGDVIDKIINPDKKILDEITDRFIRVYNDASVREISGVWYCSITNTIVGQNKVTVECKILDSYSSKGSVKGEYIALISSLNTLSKLKFNDQRVFVYSDISSINIHMKRRKLNKRHPEDFDFENIMNQIHAKLDLFSVRNPNSKISILYLDYFAQKNYFYGLCHKYAYELLKNEMTLKR